MPEVVVTVVLHAKPGMGGELRDLMLGSVSTTHGDEGCRAYALHVANDDADCYVLVERWIDQAALDTHLGQPFIAELFAALESVLVAGPVPVFSSPIPAGAEAKGTLAAAAAVGR